ncbi:MULTISPECIES: D-alanyl-D-alanine carboxypeptidase family protein [unclassified Paenibacillus]|uniref:D-alanyl-D-alanine carboxypeptidase family protein n=1 Tax=unclassified Paenibacillus TaxID=185978 RepID=UPI001AE44830|nr:MULTISPECIES: D-alanyl-D-alanine carboxypeptidase family protein [unclassified Paenibacillus]MBP1154695.1 D-alanyl-D-alanine carboxypeptidase [Paenibacillus sp. PvP091]MBP1169921.1 D-alanyl-D-alanine carboxypeptidase [Paenibacillus sp. PvR098]MBP2440949.1 D-alanyl-D-alanine carboxypeptidase [Paenibacillus sp. PvP052]
MKLIKTTIVVGFILLAGFKLYEGEVRAVWNEIPWMFAKGPKLEATAAVLLDAETGELMYSVNGDTPLPPASMSKMMTEYIVLEHIGSQKLSWNEKVKISPRAAGVVGAKVPLRAGDRVSVKDLFAAVAVDSANDAAVALAERVAGSEEAFAALMNEKAKSLGLSKHTHYINATGLSRTDMGSNPPEGIRGEQQMTAADTAKLASRLIQDYPDILSFTDKPSYRLAYQKKTVVNTNEMLRAEENQVLGFEGLDGLKTGFTDEAGYCFTGTAVRDGKRLISVVMGTSTSNKRFEETKILLSYGFKD